MAGTKWRQAFPAIWRTNLEAANGSAEAAAKDGILRAALDLSSGRTTLYETPKRLPLVFRLCMQFAGGLVAFGVLAAVTFLANVLIRWLRVHGLPGAISELFEGLDWCALGCEALCFLAFLFAETKSFILAVVFNSGGHL